MQQSSVSMRASLFENLLTKATMRGAAEEGPMVCGFSIVWLPGAFGSMP